LTRLLRVFAATTAVVTLLLLASVAPFLWPATDEVERADAVILLSGDHGERLPVAMRLIERGVAPTLVFDGTPDRALEEELCAHERRFEAVCLRPQPDSTRAEARAAAELAERRGWRNIVVVTSTFHITRSRILFNRCFDGTVKVVGGRRRQGVRALAGQVAHEWLGSVHALTLARGC